jgi:hypothetical protein
MKTRAFILLFSIGMVLPVSTYSQGALLRKALNRQLGKEVDSTLNKKTQDEKNKSQDQDQGKTAPRGLGIFGGNTDIKHADDYSFTGRIYMQMETYDKKEVRKSDYNTYFNKNTKNAAIEVKTADSREGETTLPTVFLFDNDNRCFMVLLDNGDSKTGVISTIPSDSSLTALTKTQKGPNPELATITKTGNSRVIAGYKCDEYKIEEADKNGYSNVWMTKDINLNADKRTWGKAGMPSYYNYPGLEGSMMLAMEAYDKNNKLGMKMETKEINENFNHSVSVAGYSFIKMNFGQAGKK